ncbi:hypothetical protein PUN28_020313 [Cardiocondyla obscurior]|uniref:Uncharacterized protein n=1 Tax=Cardiocondyla obscurior TaxID=286306 RepID=A0AAW2E4K1_9HYME
MAKKQKKIFLKFNNIALCGIQNRCIWAYSELFIFIRSQDMAKKRKKIFLKFNNIMHLGLFELLFSSEAEIWPKTKKIFLKFTTCIRAYFELLFSSEAEIWPKNEKNIFEILQRSIVRHSK